MSVVEKVKTLLDERGVRYKAYNGDYSSYYYLNWCDECGDYLSSIVVKGECVTVERSYLTPEQAVAAAFGSETCRYVPDRTTTAVCVSSGVTGHCECEACGKSIDPWDGYCRHCGAKITGVRW